MGNQVESLKKYLRRLGAGEDLEKVRKDFAVEFQDVDATVIMKAEQEMLAEVRYKNYAMSMPHCFMEQPARKRLLMQKGK